MKKRLTTTLILTILFWTSLSAQNTDSTLSLKDCLKTGLESAQSIINTRLENSKLEYQKSEVIGKLFPQIDAFGTYDDYLKTPTQMVPGEIFGQPGTTIPISLFVKHNITAGFKATQTLYDQTAFTAISISHKAEEISKINLEKAQDDLIYDVTRLYYLIKVTEDQIKIYQENIDRLESLSKITELKYKAGFLLDTDVQRVKVDRENLITEKNNLDLLLQQQTDMLKYTIGLKNQNKSIYTANVVLTDSLQKALIINSVYDASLFFNESPEALISRRPETQLLEKQMELTQLNKSLAIAGYFPTLSFYGQYYYQSQRDKFDFFEAGEKKWFDVSVIGLNLSIPIFDGLQKNSRINQAEVDYRKASNDYEFTKRYLGIEYNNAVNKYKNSVSAEARQKDNVELAKKVYDQTLKQYQQGVASLSDLLGVENSLSNARLSLLNSVHQLRMAELDILKSSGKLKTILNQ